MHKGEITIFLLSLALLIGIAVLWSYMIGHNQPYDGETGWPFDKEDNKKEDEK